MTWNPAAPKPTGSDEPNGNGNVVIVGARGGPTTLSAWHHYVTKPLQRPEMSTRKQYDLASSAQQDRYNQARQRYHRGLADFETQQMQAAHHEIDDRVKGTDGCPPTARSGLVLNGIPLVGKSTILLRWGKKFEEFVRADAEVDFAARTDQGALFIPVVFVSLREGEGARGLCRKILRFYGDPFSDSWSEDRLTARLNALAVNCSTRVILVDQMQELKMANRSAQQTAAHLKYLMDVLPVTFIGAGVNMDATGFFSEGRSAAEREISQVGVRFAKHDITPYDKNNPADRHNWNDLLNTIGKRLVLLNKRDNDLPILAEYLWDRTGGVTGHLMDLIRRGANRAVGKEERVTRRLLDQVRLSTNVEHVKARHATSPRSHYDQALNDYAAAATGEAIRKTRQNR